MKLEHPEKYLTFWSLIISFTIIALSVFKNIVPVWLLLFAMSLLTSTSIIGTFGLTIPNISSSSSDPSRSKTIVYDSIVHLCPLIIALLIFPFVVKRTRTNGFMTFNNQFKKNIIGRRCRPIESNYFFIVAIPAIILSIFYTAFSDIEKVYKNKSIDTITLVILSFAVFVSSYHIYFNWFLKTRKF